MSGAERAMQFSEEEKRREIIIEMRKMASLSKEIGIDVYIVVVGENPLLFLVF